MAIDIKVKDITADQVQKEIKENYPNYFKDLGITAIETDTPSWTHVSCENHNSESLVLIPYCG